VTESARHGGFLRHLAVFAWLLVAAIYATWPLAADAATRVAGNLGDPLEIAWRFAWAAHAVVQEPLRMFHANMGYPEPYTLAYSENHLGVSLPLAPLFWLTGNALLSLNVEILLVLAVGGFGVYLLVHRLGGSRGAAVVAGTAYTVVGFRISSAGLGHVHVLAVHLLPFVLLVLLRLRRDGDRRTVGALTLLVALQWWSSLTGALVTMLAVGAWGVWELARLRREAWPQLWRAGAGTALGILLALPVLLPYLEVRRLHPDYAHPLSELLDVSATPASYLSPLPTGPVLGGVYRAMADRFHDREAAGEKQLFPGFWLSVAAAATLAAAARRRGERWAEPVGLLGVMAVTGFFLSLGPRLGARADGLALPFALLDRAIPGSLMRAPARIGVLSLLALCAIAGLGLARLGPDRRRWLVAASLVLLALEAMPPRLGLVRPPPVSAAHRALSTRPGAVLALPTLELAPDGHLLGEGIARETQHLYLSTANFRPLTNSYGYYSPANWELIHAVQDIPSESAFRALQRRGVETVLVQTKLARRTRWADVEKRLRRWPGVSVFARGRGVVAFDITRAG
jgi:hypothetical protein